MAATPETTEYFDLSPLTAAAKGRSEEERFLLFQEFDMLDEDLKHVLASPETVEMIKTWVKTGIVPQSYVAAISKLLGLAALREVPVESIQPLLEKLGLATNSSALAAAEMTKFLQLFSEAQKHEDNLVKADEEAVTMTEMPPMTRPMENGPKPLVASPNVPQRNIIDLRKDQA